VPWILNSCYNITENSSIDGDNGTHPSGSNESDNDDLIGSDLTLAQHATLPSILIVSSGLNMASSTRIFLLTRSKWKLESYHGGGVVFVGHALFFGCVARTAILDPVPCLELAVCIWNYWQLFGFLLTTFGICTAFYSNFLLSLTFLWIVYFEWKTVSHAVAWIVPLVSRIPVVIGEGINPSTLARICAD
jgi:hypothetical protein